MTIIELQLDEKTLERAQRIATLRQSSLEALIREIIDLLAGAEETSDPLVGMFAREPELIDDVLAAAMTAREIHPLRAPNG
jgi:hypothetical protein